MEVNIRYRRLTVPDSILDIWYFDKDDPGAISFDRPSVGANAVALEYILKPDQANWTFYIEYMGSDVEDGYWDDYEDGDPDHTDGDWISVDGFGAVVFGLGGARELVLTGPENDVWVSLLMGGGLGVGLTTGEIIEWNAGWADLEEDCRPTAPAYQRWEDCEPDGSVRVPGILPFVDLTAAIKFNFGDYAHIRFEGGLHNLLFYGTSVGVNF